MRFKIAALLPMIVALLVSGASGQEKITVQAGIGVYPDPRTAPEVYVEFPFVIKRNAFEFLLNDSGSTELVAGVYADLILSDTLGNPIDTVSTSFLTRARDAEDAKRKDIRLFNKLKLLIEPGIYSAKLTVIDVVSKLEGAFNYDRIEIAPIETERLNISSIELAHNIFVDEHQGEGINPLSKNGRVVVPNPMGIFSEADSLLYVYAEVYNLGFTEGESDTFVVHYLITDGNGVVMDDLGLIPEVMPGSTAVISNVLTLSGYVPGKYILNMEIEDKSNNSSDTSKIQFVLFPLQGTLPEVVQYTIKHPYDSASLKTKYQLVKFLLDPQKLKMLESLNDSGKVRLIDQFIADMDPDIRTEENEYLNDKFLLYMYANENFSSLPDIIDGWRSDQGRILIQYGPWSELSDLPSPAYGKPVKIWRYHRLQGGVVFVFQDVTGYGNYRLVHSSARGELFDTGWEQTLKDYSPVLFE